MSQNLSPSRRRIDREATIAHLGGHGIDSALAYIGTRRIGGSETEVRLHLNGKPGWHYVLSITVDFGDLRNIELWGLRGQTKKSLGKQEDVYLDELQVAVEHLYDTVMRDA